ncbi:Concanavalin A-like lectin/glucanases superfamily protein [Colletotrichum asianum]
MSLQDILEPNLQRYTAQLNGRYVCTRLVTHNGVTIAIALGKTQSNSFFFDYSILDLQDEATTSKSQSTTAAADTDKLDSQCWSSNAKRLQFSSEVRVVGEEAIPVYQIPAVDRSYRKVIRSQSQKQKLDQWLSSSLCLMNQKVFDFQVLSDGRYVYVFRQSASAEAKWPNQFMSESHDGKPPVNNNLLCDRFALVGSTLSQPLETRYQRSRQKQIPLNEQDTLRVKDINDEPFYEPTHSLRFVRDLVDGRFCVLRAPTVTNNVTKWMIFAYSCKMGQIECLTTDVASNGLFDLHGHVYYTCESDTHPTTKVFANGPGPCTAAKDDGSGTCSKARVPIMPKTPASKRAVELSGDAGLQLREPVDLSSLLDGFTLEGWVKPESADNGTEETTKDSSFSVFRVSDNNPGTFINDELRLTIQLVGEKKAIVTSETALKADEWNHVAVTCNPTTSTYGLVINGAAAGSAISSNPPGSFLGIGLQPKGSTSCFTGLFDEVRVWSRTLHPSAIKDRMCKRATGLEPDLESCWHFDEDSGTTAFDATVNHRELMVVSPEDGTPSSDSWVPSAAPMVSSYGLSRRILRVSAPLQIKGGLCATVYNEQVAVSEKKTTDSERGSSSKQKSGDGAQPKHMKRGARVLLCFISGTDASPLRLAALDFGLLSDGTLADTPALMNPQALTADSFNSASAKVGTVGLKVPTALLYVGGEGMEIFGGVVALDAVGCEPSAPYAFESATGTVTVYFKARGASGEGHFSALNYNISRKAVATELCASTLGENEGLLATSKLQHAENVVVQTDLCPWAPENLAFNLTLTANMVDGRKIVETWAGVPSKLEQLCSLINGTKLATTRTIGHMAQLTNGYADMETPPTEIALLDVLTNSVTAGTFLSIGMRSYFVLKDAQAGDKNLVAVLYNDQRPRESPPGKGAEVTAKGYQHELLVTCEGKPAGNFSLGSGIVSMAWSPSAVISGAVAKASEANIQVPGTSFISGSSQSPYFGSPPRSTALRLDGRTKCYSMLEDTVATAACAGICFETWIKVEPESINTIAVAYTSERLPRAEGLAKEQQTFVLGITQPSGGGAAFDMIGNVNGTRFAVSRPSALRFGEWTHFACSSQSVFALMSSGQGYVDLGKSEEWNVSDFLLAFTLKLNKKSEGDDREHCILVKGDSNANSTPLNVKVSSSSRLQLSYWAMDEDGTNPQRRVFESPKAFDAGKAYKVFLSRKLVQVSQKESSEPSQPPRSKPPRPCQQVTMRAWDSKGEVEFEMIPRSLQALENDEIAFNSPVEGHQIHGSVQMNQAPLSLGGASWAKESGLRGAIGSIRLYSSAIKLPESATELCAASESTNGMVGSWSCRKGGGVSLVDDLNRNHGKFQGELSWVRSPYDPDSQLSFHINASEVKHKQPEAKEMRFLEQASPTGPHQLSIGNVLMDYGNEECRFLRPGPGFCGEFDELRIWNTPRTRENICDSMNTSLTETTADLAVYLPFHDERAVNSPGNSSQGSHAVLTDTSANCWHLTPLFGSEANAVSSQAPVGQDSPCVDHTLRPDIHPPQGATIVAGPSVAEYGDMEIGASGTMEGSYKRAYAYIDEHGEWCLVTGFRIGALKTEWVSQVQTSPTLVGFIEGAPPVLVDSFISKDKAPTSPVKFKQSTKCTYTYSARAEVSTGKEVSSKVGAGIDWEVEAGMGVETKIAEGSIGVSRTRAVDVSVGMVNNEVHASSTNINMEMGVQLTSIWKDGDDTKKQAGFEPSNTGLALIESEAADVFALRLQMRGSIAPVVAYQMRPNPDIPKDRNLVSFEINPTYTKQGCLDGRRGATNDLDYPALSSAPKDASYFKPTEAYALRERIRRAEEQLQGEYDRQSLLYTDELPQRTHRNICNAYVWTADGGTFQETNSTLDMVKSEVGGNLDTKTSLVDSDEEEVSVMNINANRSVDAMFSAHFNFVTTKDKSSEEGFELATELPPSVDIRYQDKGSGKYFKTPGAVDAYRWMSFWLEPSVEATDTFFEHVLNHVWLEESPEPNAQLLRTLREGLKNETGNARTKAWRVLHRCTYVSRIPEKIESRPRDAMSTKEQKPSTLLADIGSNWLLIQKLEPFARDAKSRGNLATTLKPHVLRFFPTLIAQTRLYNQVLEMLADYVGLS